MNDEKTTPKGGGTTGGTTGTDSGDSAGGGTGRFGRAKEAAGEKYNQAADAVKNRYSAVKERVDDVDFAGMTDNVRTYVRSNPGKALLISVGVGFLVGLLLRRDQDED